MEGHNRAMNAARRPHTKTRTGCRTCKRRKIKCDEGRPSCWNCLKHSVICDFLPDAGASPGSTSTVNGTASHKNAAFISGKGFWYIPGYICPDVTSPSGTTSYELNMQDMELLHHWTISTSLTMTSDPVVRTTWRTTVPQIAFQNPFVMRGILALSSLHLAHLTPSKRDIYLSLSTFHHEMALPEATSVLPAIDASNCNALHIFSILTAIHTLGRPRQPEDFLVVGEQGIAKWLVLFQGVVHIIEPFEEIMAQGPLAPFCTARMHRQQQRVSCIETATTDYLSSLREKLLTSLSTPEYMAIYTEAIDSLSNSFNFMYSCPAHSWEMGDVFIWLFCSSGEYLHLLKEGRQEALAIFAYACVLFGKLEVYWWMEGWSGHLMLNLWRWLDEEHRGWIEWPVNEIGWRPPYELVEVEMKE